MLKEAVRRMSFSLFTNNLDWTGVSRNDNENITFVKQSLRDLQCRYVLESELFCDWGGGGGGGKLFQINNYLGPIYSVLNSVALKKIISKFCFPMLNKTLKN